VIQGGPGAEELRAQTDGPVTVSAGDGDDRVNVVAPASTVDAGSGNDRLLVALGTNPTGRAPSRVDAGAGNDSVLAALPDESAVFGGPGNDNLDVGTENTTGKETILRQRVDCGEGADAAHIDARDVLGPGCAPGLREPARDMTAGRFDDTGRIRVTLGRVSPARARIGLTGPRPPAMSATTTTGLRAYAGVKLVPRASGTLSTTITPIASVRRSLRKRRASVRNVYVSLESSAPGAPSGDRATLFVRTVLRRAPGR
jgi:hypothetical protein